MIAGKPREQERAVNDDRLPEKSPYQSKIHNIFLIGYRGTGKTTVAQCLAKQLGWRFVDSDRFLEERHGRSIRQIFAEEGEAGFRDKEGMVLEGICHERRQVVATGGGVVLRPENRTLLRAGGWTVWLTADAPTIYRRLEEDSSSWD